MLSAFSVNHWLKCWSLMCLPVYSSCSEVPFHCALSVTVLTHSLSHHADSSADNSPYCACCVLRRETLNRCQWSVEERPLGRSNSLFHRCEDAESRAGQLWEEMLEILSFQRAELWKISSIPLLVDSDIDQIIYVYVWIISGRHFFPLHTSVKCQMKQEMTTEPVSFNQFEELLKIEIYTY